MANKVLVAFDGSANSIRAAVFALHTARYIPDTAIEIVFVLAYTLDEARFLGASPEMLEQSEEELGAAIRAKINHQVSHGNIPYKLKILKGEPAEGIINHARNEVCSQIIIGSRGWGKLRNLLLGSVSLKVVQNSPCTVTVVK